MDRKVGRNTLSRLKSAIPAAMKLDSWPVIMSIVQFMDIFLLYTKKIRSSCSNQARKALAFGIAAASCGGEPFGC